MEHSTLCSGDFHNWGHHWTVIITRISLARLLSMLNGNFALLSSSHDFIGEFSTTLRELTRGPGSNNQYAVSRNNYNNIQVFKFQVHHIKIWSQCNVHWNTNLSYLHNVTFLKTSLSSSNSKSEEVLLSSICSCQIWLHNKMIM